MTRFLADESCDFGVVRALRQAGHDVVAVAERESRSVDEFLIAEAARDARILVTEDKDFGWLAFVKGVRAGVILVRWPAGDRHAMAATVVSIAESEGARLAGCFTVVEPGRVRMTKPP